MNDHEEDRKPKVKRDKVVSCAECRRLKLKCDRIFPCSSCRKRGLASLCPTVALPTRPRKQLAAVAKSDATMSEMAGRIRELEEALRSLNAIHSSQHHPLLDDTSAAPLAISSAGTSERPNSPEEEVEYLGDSLGTLTIDLESGDSSFFGQSAGMESLYHYDLHEGEPSSPSIQEQTETTEDYILYHLYPHVSGADTMKHLETQLPLPARAWELCDLYYNNAAWLYSPITRAKFEEEIFRPVYATACPSLTQTMVPPTDVGIMFMVFAIGSMLDPTNPAEAGDEAVSSHSETGCTDQYGLPPHTMLSEAGRYHQLARAALAAGTSIIGAPTISGVRGIFLMAYYHMLLDRKETPHNVWSLSSLAMGLAVSIGLHRDGGPWNLDAIMVEQRRALFWELYFFISVQVCLAFGRPPQVTLTFIDCELGSDDEQQRVGETLLHGYRYRLKLIASTLLSDIRDLVLRTEKVQYKDVLLLDRKLRDCAVTLFGGEVGGNKVGPEVLKGANRAETMQRFFMLALKETMVIYLHRKYFVRVCTLPAEALPKSRYCPSFLAAFRSAQLIITLMGNLLILEPELPRRFWFFWNHTLASAIIVGSLVIRHPRSVLAPDAMKSLEYILEQLKRWSHSGERVDRPTKALKFVTQLHERARWALSLPIAAERSTSSHSAELSVLGGHARVFPVRPVLNSSAQSSGSSDSISPASDVHPSLMDDMYSMNSHATGRPSGSQGYQSLGVDPGHDAEPMYLPSGAYGASHMTHAYKPEPSSLSNMFVNAGAEYFPEAQGAHMPTMPMHERVETFPAAVPMLGDMGVDEQMWGEGIEGHQDMSWQGFVAGLGLGGSEQHFVS